MDPNLAGPLNDSPSRADHLPEVHFRLEDGDSVLVLRLDQVFGYHLCVCRGDFGLLPDLGERGHILELYSLFCWLLLGLRGLAELLYLGLVHRKLHLL